MDYMVYSYSQQGGFYSFSINARKLSISLMDGAKEESCRTPGIKEMWTEAENTGYKVRGWSSAGKEASAYKHSLKLQAINFWACKIQWSQRHTSCVCLFFISNTAVRIERPLLCRASRSWSVQTVFFSSVPVPHKLDPYPYDLAYKYHYKQQMVKNPFKEINAAFISDTEKF